MSELPPTMAEVIRADGRYAPQAYRFLQEGLTQAEKRVHGDLKRESDEPRHVSGQQLCWALRDLARERWGMLAVAVLGGWGVRETMDFGEMVYLLIEHDFMRNSPTDAIEDFRDVYDFGEAFRGLGKAEPRS